MARVVKNKEPHHALTIKDDNGLNVVLVRGGTRAYLWADGNHNRLVNTVSGVKTLRALAKAILKEVGKS